MTVGSTAAPGRSSRVKKRPRIRPMSSVLKNSGDTCRRAGSLRKSRERGRGVPSISVIAEELRPAHGASDE
jgi:hypothetical protein